MALITICPHCSTTFRVSSEQLHSHNGDVRCGQCDEVFNGFATLVTVEESEIEYVAKPTEKLVIPPIIENNHGHSVSNDEQASTLNDKTELPLSFYLNQKKEVEQEEKKAEATKNAREIVEIYKSDEQSFSDSEISSESTGFLDAVPAKKTKRSIWWLLGSLILSLLLVVQMLYVFRSEVSVTVPSLRPSMEQFCAVLSCKVDLPKDLSQLSIVTSDLKINPSQQTNVIKLYTTIQNHAAYTQAMPALKLTLTDIHGEVLAHRIITPQDYQGESINPTQGIKSNDVIEIILDLDTDDLQVIGYRLALLYL